MTFCGHIVQHRASFTTCSQSIQLRLDVFLHDTPVSSIFLIALHTHVPLGFERLIMDEGDGVGGRYRSLQPYKL